MPSIMVKMKKLCQYWQKTACTKVVAVETTTKGTDVFKVLKSEDLAVTLWTEACTKQN